MNAKDGVLSQADEPTDFSLWKITQNDDGSFVFESENGMFLSVDADKAKKTMLLKTLKDRSSNFNLFETTIDNL